jgi:integrase/recombinase XerD
MGKSILYIINQEEIMPHIRKKKNGTTQIIYRDPLKRRYEQRSFPPGTSPEIIDAELANIEYEIKAHKAGLKVFSYGQEKIDNITLIQFAILFNNDEERNNDVSSKTQKRNKYAMDLFIELMGSEMRIADITKDHISQFKIWLFNKRKGDDKDSKKRGVNKELTNLNAIFNYGVKKGYIPENIKPKFEKFKVTKKIPDVLNSDEILRISQQLDGDYLFSFQIIMLTGARRGAIVKESLDSQNGLKWRDVDWFRNVITLRDKGKEKVVPIHPDLRKILINRKNELGKNFNPEDHVVPFCQSTINQTFKKAMRRAHVNKKGSVHILRHSWATEALKQGANIREIQEWLGHSEISTTQIYTHIVNDELQDLAKKIKIELKK